MLVNLTVDLAHTSSLLLRIASQICDLLPNLIGLASQIIVPSVTALIKSVLLFTPTQDPFWV